MQAQLDDQCCVNCLLFHLLLTLDVIETVIYSLRETAIVALLYYIDTVSLRTANGIVPISATAMHTTLQHSRSCRVPASSRSCGLLQQRVDQHSAAGEVHVGLV